MRANNFIVTVIKGPTFITDSLPAAYEVALNLIGIGYAPHIQVYSTIGVR